MMIDMKVSGLTLDPFTNMPIVVLKDPEEKTALPIWIGLIEASAIATELERIQLARPMTHDLLHGILGQLGVKVERIEITDLRDTTFYASIFLAREGEPMAMEIDSRPSDAIALALRARAPIRVAKKVIDRARKIDLRVPEKCDAKGARGKEAGAREPGAKRTGGKGTAPALSAGAAPPPPRPNGVSAKARDGEMALDLLESLTDEEFGKWKM